MTYFSTYDSPLGPISLASQGESLIGAWMEGQKYFAATIRGETCQGQDLPVLRKAKDWLDQYFAGEKPPISSLPLAPQGSPFRQRVWQLLCEIPYGQVTTYGDLARQLAKGAGMETMSAQAVGGAVGHNPISIIIPCHRVVGAGGSLTGYAGGLQKKIQLLKLEGVDLQNYFIPQKGTAL